MSAIEPSEPLVEAVRALGREHRPASVSVVRNSVTCACGVESTEPDGLERHRAELAYAAMVEHLGLVEDWAVAHAQGIHPGPFTEESARKWLAQDIENDARRRLEARGRQRLLRRLVSKWEDAR